MIAAVEGLAWLPFSGEVNLKSYLRYLEFYKVIKAENYSRRRRMIEI